MTQPDKDKVIQLQQTLDRLGIEPETLLKHLTGVAAGAVSTPDLIETRVQRAGDPFAKPLRDWHVNPDTLNARLQAKFFPTAPANPITYGFCYKLTHEGRTLFKDRLNSARVTTPPLNVLGATIPSVPGIPWDYNVLANLCSVSKVITAIAVDIAMRENGVDPGEPIVNYLPGHWTPHWNNISVSIHDVLRHESGLGWIETGSGFGDYAAARRNMELASSGWGPGTYNYKNANYAILRVALPVIAKALKRDFSVGAAYDDGLWNLITTNYYRDFCNERIFAPANVGPFDFLGSADFTHAYGTPPTAPGAYLPDVTGDAGSSGWHMSLDELMKVMTEFRHGGTVMSRRKSQILLENLYGVVDSVATNAGTIYAKRGRYNDGGANTLDTAIYFIPGKMELGVFINSGPGVGVNQPSYNDEIMQLIVASVEAR